MGSNLNLYNNQTDSLAQLPNQMSYPPQRTRNRMYDRMYDQIYNPPEQAQAFLQQARDLRPQVQARARDLRPQVQARALAMLPGTP